MGPHCESMQGATFWWRSKELENRPKSHQPKQPKIMGSVISLCSREIKPVVLVSFSAGVSVLFRASGKSSKAAAVAQGRQKLTPEVLVLALHRLPARASYRYRYRYRESQFSPRVAGAWCRQVFRV